jgi:VWFA-related protein
MMREVVCAAWMLGAAAGVWAQQTKAPAQSSSPRVVVTVNAVLIPVVVRDAQGHAVGNLKKEDFQVFEKNKPQPLSGFSIEKRAPLPNNNARTGEAAVAGPAAGSGNAAAADTAHAAPQRFIVYLFDDVHLSASDLTQIQKAAAKTVADSLATTDIAGVVSLSGSSSGLTQDKQKLQDSIMNLKVQSTARPIGRLCPDIGYYEADRIKNKHDFMAQDTAVQNTMACCQCTKNVAEGLVDNAAAESLQAGDQDVRMTLGFINSIVRKMGTMPGQRTLVLVSPGFLTMSPDAMFAKSQILDLAAQSSVTINAVDARGMYTATRDAGDNSRGSAKAEQTESQYHGYSMVLNEDVMAELADGTGGIYFHNSNDLEGGLEALTVVPEFVYLLEMSPENLKLDGAYHALKVKVDREGLKVEARRGFFAAKK